MSHTHLTSGGQPCVGHVPSTVISCRHQSRQTGLQEGCETEEHSEDLTLNEHVLVVRRVLCLQTLKKVTCCFCVQCGAVATGHFTWNKYFLAFLFIQVAFQHHCASQRDGAWNKGTVFYQHRGNCHRVWKCSFYIVSTFLSTCLPVPAVVDVEVCSHHRSWQHTSVSACDGVNDGGYRPPVDTPGNAHNVCLRSSTFHDLLRKSWH